MHPSDVDWIPGFLRRAAADLLQPSVRELATAEPERILRGAGVSVTHCPIALYCGGSTARAVQIPWHRYRAERRLCGVHETLHVAGKRLGVRRCEADWWLATAALVHLAVREGREMRFPVWFVGEIPVEIVHLFG